MAIVFKDTKIERKQIVKDGESGTPTTFWFEVTPALRRQVFLNAMGNGGYEQGLYATEVFRKALVDWQGLKDENGADIPFSEDIRDKLVMNTDTFSVNDILDMFDVPKAETEPEATSKKKHSTSKKH